MIDKNISLGIEIESYSRVTMKTRREGVLDQVLKETILIISTKNNQVILSFRKI